MKPSTIIDAHHHFWQLSRFPYRWLASDAGQRPFGDHSAIKSDYLPADYARDQGDLFVAASVHVQANAGAHNPAEETRWVDQTAQAAGMRIAIVGEADPFRADFEEVLERHAAVQAFRGIRLFAGWDPAPIWRQTDRRDLLASETFEVCVSALRARGRSLDLALLPAQLAPLAERLADLPEIPIVINHLATLRPDQPGEQEIWHEGITRLAPFANVHMKLSGLWSIDRGWAPAYLAPYVTHVLEAFGPERCMYGSNMPVEGLMVGMPAQVAALSSCIPPRDHREIFRRTAARFYRLSSASRLSA